MQLCVALRRPATPYRLVLDSNFDDNMAADVRHDYRRHLLGGLTDDDAAACGCWRAA